MLKRCENAVKNFNVLATNLNILYNYLDDTNKIIFRSLFIYSN